MGKAQEQTLLERRQTRKNVYHHYHQRNSKGNHNETPSHISQNGCKKSKKITHAGEGGYGAKEMLIYTVGSLKISQRT